MFTAFIKSVLPLICLPHPRGFKRTLSVSHNPRWNPWNEHEWTSYPPLSLCKYTQWVYFIPIAKDEAVFFLKASANLSPSDSCLKICYGRQDFGILPDLKYHCLLTLRNVIHRRTRRETTPGSHNCTSLLSAPFCSRPVQSSPSFQDMLLVCKLFTDLNLISSHLPGIPN